MKIRQVGAEVLHADGRTDRHDETNERFSKFWEGLKSCTQNMLNLLKNIKYFRNISISLQFSTITQQFSTILYNHSTILYNHSKILYNSLQSLNNSLQSLNNSIKFSTITQQFSTIL